MVIELIKNFFLLVLVLVLYYIILDHIDEYVIFDLECFTEKLKRTLAKGTENIVRNGSFVWEKLEINRHTIYGLEYHLLQILGLRHYHSCV